MANRTPALPDSRYLKEDAAGRLCAPSAERNLGPIREKLGPLLPRRGKVLELASGTGQQIAALAASHPGIEWQPSDIAAERLGSIRAWRDGHSGRNLREPVCLDAAGDWPGTLSGFDLILVVNLFHLISAAAAERVIAASAKARARRGVVFIYGPFMEGRACRSAGGEAFDASLRRQSPEAGYKDRFWMEERFAGAGLMVEASHDMPANDVVAGRPSCLAGESFISDLDVLDAT